MNEMGVFEVLEIKKASEAGLFKSINCYSLHS